MSGNVSLTPAAYRTCDLIAFIRVLVFTWAVGRKTNGKPSRYGHAQGKLLQRWARVHSKPDPLTYLKRVRGVREDARAGNAREVIKIIDLDIDHFFDWHKANAEAHKSIKRYQGQLRDVEQLFEEESRQRQEISEKAGLAERRANALQGELEESRALLDSADRGKKQADL